MSDAGTNSNLELRSSVVEESKPVLSVVQTAGALLSTARVQAGYSVDQVAEQLKLSHRQVVALENNQFEQLPKMVIVRGFVRSYAKLLKVDPAVIIASLPKDAEESNLDADLRPTLATPFMESRTPFLGRSDNHNKKYLIGAVFLAFAALLFLLAQRIEQSGSFKHLFNHTETLSDATAPQEVVPAVVSQPAVNAEVASVKQVSRPVEESSDQKTVLEPVGAALPAESSAATAAPLVGSGVAPVLQDSQLRLKFRQDSWIQLKTAAGIVITAHVAKAGTEETFEIKEPLQLKIGNAAGVDAWARGNALEIVPAKDTNVVNLNVK